MPEACVHSHSGSSTSRSLERLQDRHTCSCLQKNLPPRKEWENLPLFSFSVPRGRHLDIFSSMKSSQVISPPSFQVRLIKEEEPHWLFWFQLRKETTGQRREESQSKANGGPSAVQPQHAPSELAEGVASTEDSEPRHGKRNHVNLGASSVPLDQPSLRNSFPH